MKNFLIFGIFLMLTQKKHCTAKEIAEHFEVSTRSIYRYIDALNMAGVPIVSISGKNGGFSIMENFSLNEFVKSSTQNLDDCKIS
ncbi:MAG: HTH domain-containing protein [Clostridia bacterium]